MVFKVNFKNRGNLSGLTLIELVVYLGVLGVVMAMVLSIVVPLFRITSTVNPEARVRENVNFIFSNILQKALSSNSAEVIPDFAIRFRYNNTTSVDTIWLTSPISFSSSTNQLTGYAFNYNVGYLSLNCLDRNICATSTYAIKKSPTTSADYTGYAWNPAVGWISFNCDNKSCAGTNYKVTETATTSGAELRGYAWNDVIGWISFNCLNATSTCPTSNYSVIRNASTTYLSGYAWNDTAGWINFDGEGGRIYLKEGSGAETLLSPTNVKAANFVFTQTDGVNEKKSFQATLTLTASPSTPGQEPILVSSQTTFSVK